MEIHVWIFGIFSLYFFFRINRRIRASRMIMISITGEWRIWSRRRIRFWRSITNWWLKRRWQCRRGIWGLRRPIRVLSIIKIGGLWDTNWAIWRLRTSSKCLLTKLRLRQTRTIASTSTSSRSIHMLKKECTQGEERLVGVVWQDQRNQGSFSDPISATWSFLGNF